MSSPLPTVPVANIAPEPAPAPTGDPKADKEAEEFSRDRLERERYRVQTRHIEGEYIWRIIAFALFYVMVAGWLIMVGTILFVQGYSGGDKVSPFFRLEEQVLLALLGVSTANVLGLLLAAANYLFPKVPWWLTGPDKQAPKD